MPYSRFQKKSVFKKQYPIQIWFLDDDLVKSASYLTKKTLDKSICGCASALTTARMYFIGIRNQKFHKYFFDKDRSQNTIQQFFTNWPFKSNPSFSTYKSVVSKWCRMCNEHYQYIMNYLEILLNEWESRYGKKHQQHSFLEWLLNDAPQLNIPNGNIKKINLPWKCISPTYRRKNIIDGYRLQFINKCIDDNDPNAAYADSNVNIPEFVIRFYNLDIQSFM